MSVENPTNTEIRRSAGTILTDILIYDRPDLLDRCPKEVQKAIRLHHEAYVNLQNANHEKARELLDLSFQTLLKKES